VASPISRQARITRKAISPRFAINTFLIVFVVIRRKRQFYPTRRLAGGFKAGIGQASGGARPNRKTSRAERSFYFEYETLSQPEAIV
jgi:hypothetical protein